MATWKGCLFCKHFKKDSSCKAFPKGIPLAILSGEVEHLKIDPKQEGSTVFEPGGLFG